VSCGSGRELRADGGLDGRGVGEEGGGAGGEFAEDAAVEGAELGLGWGHCFWGAWRGVRG